jgi:hypothetical protein
LSRRGSAKEEDAKDRAKDEGGMDGQGSAGALDSGLGVDGAQATPAGQLSGAGLPDEKRSMRPRTARQRPPKVKDKVQEVEAAKVAAPKVRRAVHGATLKVKEALTLSLCACGSRLWLS